MWVFAIHIFPASAATAGSRSLILCLVRCLGVMPAKKLNQYRGRLSPKQIADGMNAAQRNARRLVDDAKLLLDAGRFPSAASLAILSIEESGKTSILRQLSVAKDDKEIADCWRAYRSHTKKNAMWILTELFSKGARKLDDFLPMFSDGAEHPQLLDQVKQISFYTDCLGNAHWSEPTDVIEEPFARTIVQIADIFARDKAISAQEIELWIQHIGPVWMANPDWMRKAVENWYSEMQQVGLKPAGPNEMEDFIRLGIIRAESNDT